MALDATVGGATANSYIDAAGGDSYFGTRPQSSLWFAQTPADKEAALIQASRMLDMIVPFYGQPSTSAQSMQWPRYGAPDLNRISTLDSTIIPAGLQNAVCELALFWLNDDRFAESGLEGFRSINAGGIQVSPDSYHKRPVLPRSIRMLLRPYGQVQSGAKLTRC